MIIFCMVIKLHILIFAKITMHKMNKKWPQKNRKIWNFQILSDRPDRTIPAIWIGRIVGKSIFDPVPSPGTHIFRSHLCGYIFVDCRPFYHIFETSKIHVLVEISAMVEISAKIFRGKKTCIPSLNLLWISCESDRNSWRYLKTQL